MSSRGARPIICEIGCRYDSPVVREAEAFVSLAVSDFR